MKRLRTLFIVAVFALPIYSQQTDSRIVVEKTDNSELTIALSDIRKITFDYTTVNIISHDGNVFSNDMSDILRIASYAQETGIDNVSFGNEQLIEFVSSDNIAVNSPAGETIAIYNINGCLILAQRQLSDGGVISISTLPKGIYLIRTNGRTAKFIKR